ncbi:MAG: hypothetical protein ACP5FT_01255 [Acidilobus sp.]
MFRRIEGRRYLTYAEARQILERRLSESGGALNPIQERTWEFLKMFGQGDPSAARKVVDSLVEAGLSEHLAVELVNMCPQDDGFINLILSGEEGLTVTEELMSKIKSIMSSYCGSASPAQA